MFYSANQTRESKQNLFRLQDAINCDFRGAMQRLSSFAKSFEGLSGTIFNIGKSIFEEYKNTTRADVAGGNVRLVPRTVENLLGNACAEKFCQREIPKGFEKWQEEIEGIGSRLASEMPKKELKFQFMIKEDDRDINAYCLPGGKIVLTTGLLRNIEEAKENQLAIVLSELMVAAEDSLAIKLAQMELLMFTTKKVSLTALKQLIPGGVTRKEIDRNKIYESLIEQGLSVGSKLLLNYQKQAGEASVKANGLKLARKAGFDISDRFAEETHDRLFEGKSNDSDQIQQEILQMVASLMKFAR